MKITFNVERKTWDVEMWVAYPDEEKVIWDKEVWPFFTKKEAEDFVTIANENQEDNDDVR